jgi:hypothetical protein
MNDMKQTAVEWLIEQWPILESQIPERILEQAKEMEKEQMIKFANEYAESGSFYCNGEFAIEQDAEQYYNETFKQETLTYTEAAKKEERIFNSTMMSKQKTFKSE